MKVHERILQEVSTLSQKSQKSREATPDFKAQLEKILGITETRSGRNTVREDLSRVLELVEGVLSLLEAVSQGEKEALLQLEWKAKELNEAAKNLSGAARHFLEELSLTAAVSATKAREGFI